MEKEAGLTFLRIKIKHLALEPELLKLEMQKTRRRAMLKLLHKALDLSKELETLPDDPRRNQINGGLVYEDPWLAIELRNHRLQAIRPEARAAQLAYAFIRGKSYNEIEPTSKWSPQINRIAELIVKYGDHTDKNAAKEALIAWIEQSGRWQWKRVTACFYRINTEKAAA